MGTPVVMLHSSMSSKEQWSKLMAELCDTFQVIAIDLSGYGGADYPIDPPSFTLADEANRIDRIILERIGTRRFHLVGHSYGAATSLRFAYANPERLISLSIFEPVAFHLLAAEKELLSAIVELASKIDSLIEQRECSQATKMFVDYWSGKGTYDSLTKERAKSLDGYIRKVVLDFQAGINEPLTLEDYMQIKTPVCMIASGQSPLQTRQIVYNLEKTLPNLETHWVDGGHMAPIGNGRSVNPILRTFIESFPIEGP
ncbi:MAG: alpha/beta fold hydrolase [Desulforhopalus sp.]